MKAFGYGLALAFVLGGAASAEIDVDNQAQGWTAPKHDVQLAQWPRNAAGQPIYGAVLLDCTVAAGHADDCKVQRSEPANPLLEKAALTLAPLFTSKDASPSRHPLEISLRFDTAPEWLKKPTLDNLMAVYPAAALRQGVSGRAVIKCTVQTSGLTRACSVVTEDRPGLGFGPAAVVLSRTFLFKPAMRAGEPVESDVTVPINFKTFGKGDDSESVASDSGGASRIQGPRSSSPTIVLGEAVWSKTPTMPQILAAIDKKAGDKFADGTVVLQCRLDSKTGKLGSCVVGNASPGMAQFSGVAKSLTADFQADVATIKDLKGNLIVNLPFAFPDMASPDWSKRYLTHPRWIRTISPDPDKATFPEQAAKAGLKTGSATVDCVVGSDGALTNCSIVSESVPGMGFGPMAQLIAQAFVANPWNEDGLPVDGAHVRMPVRMDYEPPAETPPPVTAPTPATKP